MLPFTSRSTVHILYLSVVDAYMWRRLILMKGWNLYVVLQLVLKSSGYFMFKINQARDRFPQCVDEHYGLSKDPVLNGIQQVKTHISNEHIRIIIH